MAIGTAVSMSPDNNLTVRHYPVPDLNCDQQMLMLCSHARVLQFCNCFTLCQHRELQNRLLFHKALFLAPFFLSSTPPLSVHCGSGDRDPQKHHFVLPGLQYEASSKIFNPSQVDAAARLHNIGVNAKSRIIMLPPSEATGLLQAAARDDSLHDGTISCLVATRSLVHKRQ